MLILDGSRGEGGGQIPRTALGHSVVTGRPFRIEKLRAGRSKPGRLRQHLTAMRAAKEIGGTHDSSSPPFPILRDAFASRSRSARRARTRRDPSNERWA